MGGNTTPAQSQLYSSGSTSGLDYANATKGPAGEVTPQGGNGLFFTAPGQDSFAFGTPSYGGKNTPSGTNQVPTGHQGATQPNFDPNLAMNSVYAPQNQGVGTSMTQGPDMGTASQLANQVQPLSGFSFYNPYQLGSYSYLNQSQSPMGMSSGAPAGKGGAAHTGGHA
jgi:hypothetical protein